MSIERYEAPAATTVTTSYEFDSWVPVLGAVAELAQKISGTDFVPDTMRGKPAAVAAAILAGREMGIGPMTALQNIHVIKGKPGQSAQLMRSLVLAAGHSLRFVETTDSRCIIEGRRQNEDEWERVTFTADQARRAKIDLGLYPEDKLVARASSRLCRRKFADCLAGMAYSTEELEDGDTDEHVAPISAIPAEPKRTAKRGSPRSVTVATRSEAAEAQTDTVPPPPLPGEEDDNDNDRITHPQLSKMHATFNDLGIKDRTERLAITRRLLSLDNLGTANELSKENASVLIELLTQCAESDDPRAALDALAGIGEPEPDDAA